MLLHFTICGNCSGNFTEEVLRIKITLCNQNIKSQLRHANRIVAGFFMEGEGFEPSKAEPTDLQSVPFGHSGTPPNK